MGLSTLKSFLHNFRIYPLRGMLTLVTITIGVATLIIATSLNLDISQALERSSSESGFPITIANGSLDETGALEFSGRSEFTSDVIDLLGNGYENLSDITIVSDSWIRSVITVGDTSYQIRSMVQVTDTYADLMDLTILYGDFFSAEDVESRSKLVVISSLSAELLFGSAEVAVGNTVSMFSRDGQEQYTIIGVYEEVSDLERQIYGIGDFIFPIGSNMPVGMNIDPVQFGAVIMARVTNDSVLKAEARIRELLVMEYGDDLILSVWEGSASGPATLLEEGRESVKNFALTVNILGIVILAISSIGIFSIMLVEVLNRTKEIGLRRAMGMTKAGVQRFFVFQAAYYSLFGSILGIVISLLTYGRIGKYLIPLFDNSGLRTAELHLDIPNITAIVTAVAAALIFGGLFGLFPAMSAAKTSISECIKEDTV